MSATEGSRHWPVEDARGNAPLVSPAAHALSWLQAAAGLWLLVSPFVLTGPLVLVAVKDVVVGTTLLAVTAGASRYAAVRRVENSACLALGLVLIVASIVLEFGSGSAAAARQWNEVAVGVLLVYLSAARVR